MPVLQKNVFIKLPEKCSSHYMSILQDLLLDQMSSIQVVKAKLTLSFFRKLHFSLQHGSNDTFNVIPSFFCSVLTVIIGLNEIVEKLIYKFL